MRQTITPLGLITQPNTYGQYPPGAMRQALNCVMRNPGIINPMPAVADWRLRDGLGDDASILRFFGDPQPGLDFALAVTDDKVRWAQTSNWTEVVFAELAAEPIFSKGKTQHASHRSFSYLTSDEGVLELPHDDTSFGFLAGFAQPFQVSLFTSTATAASIFANNTVASYKAIVTRKNDDGSFQKISPPTHTHEATNTIGGTRDLNLIVTFGPELTAALKAGDIVELYRTDIVASGTDPGGVFYFIREEVVASADISAGNIEIPDRVPTGSGGAELYTNPGQQGAGAAKYPPPRADGVEMFNGYAAYIASELAGFIDLRIPNKWSAVLNTAAERTHGIGARETTGDVLDTTNTITNVNDTTGLVIGQLYNGANIPNTATITDITGSTVEVSANATGTAVGQAVFFIDQIEVNGTVAATSSMKLLMTNLITNGLTDAVFTFSEPRKDIVGGATFITHYDVEGVDIRISSPYYYYDTPTVRATNGQNYSPTLPDLDESVLTGDRDPRGNRLMLSLQDQPGAVPPGRELLVGDGTIYRLLASRDSLFVFASDGLWRVSGDPISIGNLRVDLIDTNLVLASRNAADVLHHTIFCYCNRGLVMVSPSGVVQDISDGVVGDKVPGAVFDVANDGTWDITVACDQDSREVWVLDNDNADFIVYNAIRKAFTEYDPEMASNTTTDIFTMAYHPFTRSMMFATGKADANIYDLRYHFLGTASKTGGCIVDFQPLLGDDDQNTLKEWHDVTYVFEGQLATGFPIVPRYNESNLQDASSSDILAYFPANGAGKDTRVTAAVNRDAPALASHILPGFDAGAENNNWTCKGLSMRWTPAADEETRGDDGAPVG